MNLSVGDDATEPESQIARRRSAAIAEGSEAYRLKRQNIIAVAAEIFKEKGYEASTLSDIADRFGVERASLYYYVANKEELLQEVVRGVLDENVEESDRIASLDVDGPTKLRLLIQQLLASYEAHYPYVFVFIQEDMRRVADKESSWALQMARQSRRLETHAIQFIRLGIAEGTIRDDVPVKLAVNALFGMVNWTHRWLKPGTHRSTEVADTFYKVFIDGMRVQ